MHSTIVESYPLGNVPPAITLTPNVYSLTLHHLHPKSDACLCTNSVL